jgi:F-type H+-transporting ATPase subunit b
MLVSLTAIVVATAETAHEVAAEVAEKKAGLPQLNADDFMPQLFWLAVTFSLLFLIMWRVALPRIGEVIEERGDRIKRDLDAAERLKGETEKALQAYEKALGDARANASGIARQTRERLASETDSERARVDSQIAAKIADAEKRIEATKTKALTSVAEIASDTAAALVAKLTGQSVPVEEIKRALSLEAGE